MNILQSPNEYAQTCIETFGGAAGALEALARVDLKAAYPHVPAMFWRDVESLLRLETQSDETIEEAEERWASGGAFLDETRAYWFQGADLMGFHDAHVRERLAQGIESTGIDMANASWWNRHPEAWEAAVESHNSF